VFAIRAVAYLKRGNWPNDELNAENKPFSGIETGMDRRTKGRPLSRSKRLARMPQRSHDSGRIVSSAETIHKR
jgi:hypothetical protein